MKWLVLLPLLGFSALGQSTSNSDPIPNLGIPPTTTASAIANYQPAIATDRARWFVISTVSPSRLLLVGPINAGWGTVRDVPSEYATHWDGFGKRNGMRLTGVATGNLIEMGLGLAWGEDPRYFPSRAAGFGSRMKYVVRTTFQAPHRDGRWHPAYARFAGDVGNNFLSNAWRADSEANARDAAVRCLWGMLGRMTSDAFEEFWPDLRRKVLHRH